MWHKLTEFALAQRAFVLLLSVFLVAAGVMAFRGLPIDAFPDVSSTQVKIIVKAPGMTPEEVEARIVTPIERELLGIAQQRALRAVAKYAIADITLDFADGTDIYWARQQVSERLTSAMAEFPAGVSGALAPMTTPLGEMLMFTVEGDVSLAEKRSLLDWVIRPQLRTLPGVADVNALGGAVRSFEIVPDRTALQARGLSLADLREALLNNNRNDGAGRLTEGEENLLVRIEGSVQTLDDLRAIVVKSLAGAQVVLLADVAEVRIGSLTRYGFVTRGGEGEAVQGLVLGLRGANAHALVDNVHKRLAEIEKSLPPGVSTHVFYDRGALVDRAVGTVAKALLEAIVLVLILLLAFLGQLRAALVVAAVLPLAALLTFVLMQVFGLSANLMSLGGLAIAIGILVDAAVVVVENIEKHLHAPQGGEHAGGNAAGSVVSRLQTVRLAVREVSVPVVSGMLIIAIVFLPLLSLQGLEGKLFRPVALTIVFALLGSLLLSLTVIPVLASFLIRPGEASAQPWLPRQAARIYAPLLAWSLQHARQVIVLALLLLAAAGGAFFLLGKTFMPTLDEGDILMQSAKLPSISLEESARIDLAVQKALREQIPEIRDIVARTGSDELGLDPMGLNESDHFLVLAPRATWRKPDKAWLTDEIRKVLADFPGMDIAFTQPIEMRVSEMLTGTRGDLAVKIFGDDLAALNRLAEDIAALLKTLPGAEDVLTVKNEGVQYFTVRIDRLAAGRLGLSVAEVGQALRTQLEGEPLGLVLEGNRRTPLLLRGAPDVQQAPAVFAGLQLALPAGGSVALSSIAQLERVQGPVKVDHENGARLVLVQANVSGRDLVGFVEEAKARVAKEIQLPAGYHLSWGGEFENQQRAAQRLTLVVPVALCLIFYLLFATLGSLRQALLVFVNIPFALIGGVFALLLSGEYLSVPASVGFIALLGIAVLNGLVLVSCFNQLRSQGMALAEVVAEGARRRLRPVLMTASIAAFGLLPLLFASGPGSEIQRPLAIVVIGGLFSSTLLTLVVLPILYRRWESKA
ncbi:efflux RND transporter permease subunit [Azonexus sp.]|uniref:efflux RND transporter permease subunit n=1 Tax=Azonexus sp. TaxID=1872668 RepID=UPI0039E517CA